MYLKLFIFLHLAVSAISNPFHKYPYVFLLDVGNEELENTSKQQIRVSAPGGSLALRYPAVGNGEILTHVRVSGIDFGTDLKSNILDGGPGYEYVILVFMGNPGVPYDAVVTVQTLPMDNFEKYDTRKVSNVDDSTIGNINNALLEGEVTNKDSYTYIKQKNNEIPLETNSKAYNFARNNEISYSQDQDENDKDYEEGDVEGNKDREQNYNEEHSQDITAQGDDANPNEIQKYKQYRQFGADQLEHQNENINGNIDRYREETQDVSENRNIYEDDEVLTVNQIHKSQNSFGGSRPYDLEGNQVQSQDQTLIDVDTQYDNEQDGRYQLENDPEQMPNENENPEANLYNENSDSSDESYDGEAPTSVENYNYTNYNALKALLYGYNGVQPEVTASESNLDSDVENRQGNGDYDQFNDEEVHNEDRHHHSQFNRMDESAVAS